MTLIDPQNPAKKYNVIIIGGGPSGSTSAYFLAKSGLNVLLLDKATFPREKTCGDGLTPRAIGMLDELGLLETVKVASYQMDEATVFAPNGTDVTTTMPLRDDVPPLLLSIPRFKLDNMILQKAVEAGVELREGINIQNVEMSADGITVHGKQNGRLITLNSRMGLIAVGANTGLLKRIGVLKETPPLTLAARTYYENIKDLSGRFEFYFEGIPLPGYAWIFPLSDTSANIGAGIFGLHSRRRKKQTAQSVLDQFLTLPRIQHMLSNARRVGPVRGFPIRTDFAHAPTFAQNLLLAGEAAGLVNPLTGEGIDYALESGKIAAEHLVAMFEAGDFSTQRLEEYDRSLRNLFHDQVVFCEHIRDWYLHRPIINRLVRVAQKRAHFRELFTDIVLGNVAAKEALRVKTVMQIILS